MMTSLIDTVIVIPERYASNETSLRELKDNKSHVILGKMLGTLIYFVTRNTQYIPVILLIDYR